MQTLFVKSMDVHENDQSVQTIPRMTTDTPYAVHRTLWYRLGTNNDLHTMAVTSRPRISTCSDESILWWLLVT